MAELSILQRLKDLVDKIAEKDNALKTLIDNFEGVGLSADNGQVLVLGSDGKILYTGLTANEIANLYESVTGVNRFTDGYKTTVDGLANGLAGKADLDPATNKLKISQVPQFAITNKIVASETTLTTFVANVNAYVFDEGDVIEINNSGTLEHWLYDGNDRTLETSYSALTTFNVSWNNITGKPDIDQKDADTLAAANAYAESLVGGQVSPTRIDSWVLGYDSELTFNPTFNFTIDGVPYSDSRQITLAAADPTNPRKDTFVINKSTKQIEILTGTPGATAPEPDVDFSIYLKGPVQDIPAGATEPANIDITTVWNENTGTAGGEWDKTNSNPDFDYDNLENPSVGTKAVKVVGELVVNQILGFAAGTDIPIANAKELQFDLQNITAGGAFHITVIGKKSNGRTDSLQLPAPTGFDASNTSSYQTITLPISTNQLVSIHEIRFVTEVAGYKYYFDNARLLGGEGTSAPTGDYVTRSEFETLDSEVVKSVNNQTPDVNGNVNVSASPDQRETVSVATTKTMDWGAYDVFEYTMTADTTFSDSNLPTGTNAKTITIYLTGNFIPTFPAYWVVDSNGSDPYDGTVRNRIVVDCIEGTASSEDVTYNIKNL